MIIDKNSDYTVGRDKKLQIETPSLFGDYLYPLANEIRKKQQDVFWTEQEIPIEKDIHDYRHNMSKAQFNLTSVTLDLFVEIEQKVGMVWETIASWFPHSEIEGACSAISSMEKSVHAFFYQKMSDEMNIEPEMTARNQQTISVLKSKLTFLNEITKNLDKNKALSLVTVSMIEQVLLFSNFAMLKSFQANGHNLITNTVTGVDFVVQDETLHGIFASYLHNTYIEEFGESFPFKEHEENVNTLVREIISHEDAVIDYVFRGEASINDITPSHLKSFIRSRADSTLTECGFKTIYDVVDNPISKWFYKGANSIKMHDFFVSGTSSYRRSWKTNNLSRLPFLSKPKTELSYN